jgi:hypothetical protein
VLLPHRVRPMLRIAPAKLGTKQGHTSSISVNGSFRGGPAVTVLYIRNALSSNWLVHTVNCHLCVSC